MNTKMLKQVIIVFCLAAALIFGLTGPGAVAGTVIRVNLDSSLKQLDPIWTTAYIVRSHAFLVYDTLFGLDKDFKVQPQMVDRYSISDDGLLYTFTLRDGLK